MKGPAKNTDREIYRESTGDPAGPYYENSVHVTEHGAIGMNVGGRVIVLPIAEWHSAALTVWGGPLVDLPGRLTLRERIRFLLRGDRRMTTR